MNAIKLINLLVMSLLVLQKSKHQSGFAFADQQFF